MHRIALEPRPNWQGRVEKYGLMFHTQDGNIYWDESAAYQFSRHEVDQIELATNSLHEMCITLIGEIIASRSFELFLIPPGFEDLIIKSWNDDEPSIYGRFDLAFDGSGPPKMLEYNADTPTALVEAAVVQWFWLQDIDPRGDQFNSIHERLIAAWKAVRAIDPRPLHFASVANHVEDYVTVEYLRDTAIQAGYETDYLPIEKIGWDTLRRAFVDSQNRPIRHLFKLYPWEWLIREDFGPHIAGAAVSWIEPPWKMLLSCKSILPLLYDRFPDSPFLLPAWFDEPDGDYVQKPVLSREGANIQIVRSGEVVFETPGDYGPPYVYQKLIPIKPFDGNFPIIGSWVIGGEACGMGIREDRGLVTGNTSRFVPHQLVS